jgi:hypothetical protein
MGTLSQWGLQYLLPFAAGQLQPGRAHFSAFFSTMTHLPAFQYHLLKQGAILDCEF